MTVLYPEHGGLRERAPAIDDRCLPTQEPRVRIVAMCPSRWLGVELAVGLGTAVERGGMFIATGGSG